MSRHERVLAYDALRVLAILAVVGIHTLMPYRGALPHGHFLRVLDDVLHFAVPLFVFLSGVFVWGRPLPESAAGWGRFLARRVAVVGIPYAAWSAVYLGLFAMRDPEYLTAQRSAALVLSGHTWYHLYFVPMLLGLYLLTPLVAPVLRRSPAALVAGAYALWLLTGPAIEAAITSSSWHPQWSYAAHLVTHLPHMALGAWFALRGERLLARPGLAAALAAGGLAALLGVSLGLTWWLPGTLARLASAAATASTVLGLTLSALGHELAMRRYARPIVAGAPLAFGVYLVHPISLLAVWALAPGLTPVAVFAAVAASSFAVVYAFSFGRLTRRLAGLPV